MKVPSLLPPPIGDLIFIMLLSFVQAKHAQPNSTSWGIDGETGDVVDMKQYGIWEACAVRAQTFKTAIEVCTISFTAVSARNFLSQVVFGCSLKRPLGAS